jgi:hypothetical protein
MAANPAVATLLAMVDQAFDRRSWHGTNLRGSIRGLDASTTAWRPREGRHNIWELVVHAAYWKYAVQRRLTGAKRGSFPLEGSNWWVRPVNDAPADASWRRDVALLTDTHRSLREAIASLRDAELDEKCNGSTVTVRDLVTGIAAHDLYHAGQIQLLKRLAADATSTTSGKRTRE